MRQKIVIVDYRMGNPGSIRSMLSYMGFPSLVTSSDRDIGNADKIVLPGVGAFDSAMRNIQELGLFQALNKRALIDKIPVLGICLGMQILTQRSEEGSMPGFGWIPGKVVRFRFDNGTERLKIPHMGWNFVSPIKSSPLFANMPQEMRFYFVHSYHVVCDNEGDVLCATHYGFDFCSGIEHGNIFGTQFHPEKSHRYGMQLLENFVKRA
jgi:imidazole glycerol-phosphate synthase subunit HisH